jgi:O-succinylbenzoic acid--CoA ligase
MPYTHAQLSINGRVVSLPDIQQGKPVAKSAFEQASFSFIAKWLNNTANFELYTSGSTGTPKKILVTREQLSASAKATLAALSIPSNASSLICLPTQFIAGVMMLVRSLVGNLKMTLVEPAANPLANLHQESFHFAALVPYQVEEIFNQQGMAGLNKINTLLVGGAPLSQTQQQYLQNAKASVYLTYGMTETLSHVALQKISGAHQQDFFTALPSIVLSQDERACLVIEAPYLTEKVVTNDVVEFINPSAFRWIGRWDNVINSGGIKLFPEKIENAVSLAFHELKIERDFFVVGVPDEKLGTKAVLVVEQDSPLREEDLWPILERHLKRVELPKQIVYTKKFELTDTGKIKRKETSRKLGL